MIFRQLLIVCVVAMFLFGMNGCGNDGPAEKAGKAIDEAADSAKKKIDELIDK